MAWTRLLSVSLGHEFTAVLAVLAAFFVGLAFGGLALNQHIRHTKAPLIWYVALELVIGLWALLLMVILPHYNALTAHLIGSEPHPVWHWSVAFGASLLVLLPATMAMGATLPAAHRLSALVDKLALPGQSQVSLLYAFNTGGALVGTLAATYWLLPSLGLNHTLIVFAGVNFAVAAALWLGFGRLLGTAVSAASFPAVTGPSRGTKETASSDRRLPSSRWLLALFMTGLLGLGYEIVVVRVLAQILEGTVYSFAAVLSVYLLGTTIGAAAYHRFRKTSLAGESKFDALTGKLLLAVAGLCLLGTVLLWSTENVYHVVFDRLGPGNVAAMLAEVSVSVVVFLLPTIAMGALFGHLTQGACQAHGLGRAMGVNTLGSALAPLVFGVGLLPWLGALETLVSIAIGYLLLSGLLGAGRRVWLINGALTAVAISIVWMAGPLRFVSIPQGSQILAYEEGVVAAVAVIEEPDNSRHLKVNNRFTMGGTASRFSDHRQTHLPMLWHGGDPRSAVYLGLGTGITFQAAQYYPNLQATGVELIPEMLPLMREFGVDVTGSHWPHPPRILSADARRFIVAEPAQFDVIIAEVFHPSRDGAGSLYTVEHFSAIRDKLAPGGLFCQWLPLFQLDLSTLRLIVRSYLAVFPNAQLHLAHFSLRQPLLCLLGGDGLTGFSANWLLERVQDRALQQQLVQARLNSDFALFGGYLAGPKALHSFSQGVPLNTDNTPRVTFAAPSFVYGEPESPAARLLNLVTTLAPDRDSLLADDAAGSDFATRLENYWRARDVFLAAGVGVTPSTDVRAMLAQTQAPLLDAVRLSSDFLPAYDPLMQMAEAAYRVDPALAKSLLIELDKANPTLPDARRKLAQWFGVVPGVQP